MSCLYKEPARRYASAEALAEDLRRFLEGKPISARPTPTWARAVKWARRRPAAAMLLALLAVIFTGLGVATALLTEANQREREATQQAIQARLDAEEKRQLAEAKEREAIREREEARRQSRTTKEVARFLVGLFETSDPVGLQGIGFGSGREKGADLTARQLLDIGTKKVKTQLKEQPEVQAAMLDTLGHVYRSLGILDEARPMLEEGLAIRTKKLGPDHEDTATSLHHLAWLNQDAGKYRDAEDLYRQALAIRQKQLGPEDLETAATMLNLAWHLCHQDERPSTARLLESEELLRKVVKIRRERLPPGHRETFQALTGLAVVVGVRPERAGEAKELLLQAASVLGRGEHQELLSSTLLKYVLSVQLRKAKRFDEALKLHRSVLAAASDVLGDDHLLVAMLMADLGGLLRDKGDKAEAVQHVRKALDIGRRSALRGHPMMIAALMELADFERARGQPAEAEKLYREALDIAQRFDRPKLWQSTRTKLVDFLREQKRYKEAEALPHTPR